MLPVRYQRGVRYPLLVDVYPGNVRETACIFMVRDRLQGLVKGPEPDWMMKATQAI